MQSPDVVLNIQNMSVVYETTRGPLTALSKLDLQVRKGEFVAVLGPSGCGKSTLLKVVSGLLGIAEGEVTVSGQKITGPRKDVGIVFQQPTLLPWKTVRENVLVPIRAQRLPKAQYEVEADRLLNLVGLGNFGGHLPHELSGGMQQRAGIARGLIHDPAVLLMDEPFAALDALTRERMTDELQSIWMETRKTVVFITHSIQEAVYLADKVVVLSGRPGTKVLELDVNLERPRTLDTMASPRFSEVANKLREMFGAGKRNL
ncbi:ABC transporter ATP-binding protein [Ferrovibrio sp. MS7]|uniref:ABC transporter ATP-binding protein n=1 Tax=Ferrovibrio plantarum TaxID=3119164 RepID=UPI003136B019